MPLKAPTLALAAALLAGSLAAADESALLQLAMPDATVIVGISCDRIKAATAGSRYQQLTAEYMSQYGQSWRSMKDTVGYDLRDIQEILVTLRPGPKSGSAQGLVMVRAPFDPEHPPSLLAMLFTQQTTHQGVPLWLTAPGKGDQFAMAFLHRSIALFGDPDSVRAAIARWTDGVGAPSPALAKATELSQKYHVWWMARDLASVVPRGVPAPKPGDPLQRAFQSAEELTFGMVTAPSVQASLNLLARTEKDAGALRDLLDSSLRMALAQATGESGQALAKELLAHLQLTAQGRTVLLSFEIPEQKVFEMIDAQIQQKRKQNAQVVVQGGTGDAGPKPGPEAPATPVITLPVPK